MESDELSMLRQENTVLIKERDKLEKEFLSYKQEVTLHGGGTATKEIVILKKVIKNMEVCTYTDNNEGTLKTLPIWTFKCRIF